MILGSSRLPPASRITRMNRSQVSCQLGSAANAVS